MSFQGSLKELPLPDIIQLVAVSGKTGAFVLTSGRQEGKIYLRNGEIVHAEAGGAQGEEAVYELAIWQDGEFTFEPGVEAEVQTCKKSNTNLLMEAARRVDEWKVLSKRVPSTQLVPVFSTEGSGTSVSFTPNEWIVICKIDERRTIDDLASVLQLSPFEVAKLLYGLITAGLVELRQGLDATQLARIAQMSSADLELLTTAISNQARTLLTEEVGQAEIEQVAEKALLELQRGRGADAVVDLLRSLERIVGSALGPDRGRQLLDAVGQKLQPKAAPS